MDIEQLISPHFKQIARKSLKHSLTKDNFGKYEIILFYLSKLTPQEPHTTARTSYPFIIQNQRFRINVLGFHGVNAYNKFKYSEIGDRNNFFMQAFQKQEKGYREFI